MHLHSYFQCVPLIFTAMGKMRMSGRADLQIFGPENDKNWDECRLLAGNSKTGRCHPACSNANPNHNTNLNLNPNPNPNPTADPN